MDKIRAIKEAAAMNPQAVFTEKARKTGYICPLCGNGSGSDGDGVTEDKSRKGHYHCFKCGYDGDIIDWIGWVYNLDKRGAIQRGMELYSIVDEDPVKNKESKAEFKRSAAEVLAMTPEEEAKQQKDEAEKRKRQAFILNAAEHEKRFEYLEKRGISREIQQRFNIGYAERWQAIKKGACIIPTADGSFVARNVMPCDNSQRYRKGGKSQLFNAVAAESGGVVFVTEGEIDCLSILEIGFKALALGSTSNKTKLIKMYKSGQLAGTTFVLVLDNDEAGRKTAAELVKEIQALDYGEMVLGNSKDPNEALTTERGAFALRLKTAEELAAEQLEAAEDISARFKNEYSVKTDGSFWRVYPYKDGYKEQYLGDFWLKGIGVITKDDGIEQAQYIQLQPIRKGEPLPVKEISYKKFSSSGLFEELDFSLRPAVGRSIVQYYQDSVRMQFENMEKKTVYTHTGWRKVGGRWLYLHCGGAVGDVDNSLSVELSDSRLNRMYTFSGDNSSEKYNTLKNFLGCAKADIIYPLTSYLFLAPLIEFFGAADCFPGFSFYLLGKSQSGKSTLAALALCFFGSFGNKTLPASFNDTANSIAAKGFMLKDTVMVIDDFCPSGSKREADEKIKIFEKLSAAYGDRLGRSRLDSDSTLKENKTVRGLALITGELLPQVAQSRLGRNIFITMERDTERFKRYVLPVNKNKEHLSQIMAEYIAWLSKRADKLPAELVARFNDLRLTFENADYGRISEAAAFLAVAFEYLAEFLAEVQAFPLQDIAKHKMQCFNALKKLSAEQQEFLEEAEPCKVFLEALNSLLLAGKVYVRNIEEGYTSLLDADKADFIGYEDSRYYYLLPEEAYKAVFRACGDKGSFFPLSYRDLAKELADKHIIQTENGRATKRKFIPTIKKQQRFWWVDKKGFKD